MKTLPRLAFLAIALLVSPAIAAPVIGTGAPDFEATDTNGKKIKLSDFQGKVVVLEWTNPQCPFVVKHYGSGNMQKLQADAKSRGVVWVSINSSAPGKEGHMDDAAANKNLVDSKASPAHLILDSDGKIGHLYDAKTTPHMFVIDANGLLAYMGAIDDKASVDAADIPGARNYVTDVLNALANGNAPEVTNTKAYGCGVKY